MSTMTNISRPIVDAHSYWSTHVQPQQLCVDHVGDHDNFLSSRGQILNFLVYKSSIPTIKGIFSTIAPPPWYLVENRLPFCAILYHNITWPTLYIAEY